MYGKVCTDILLVVRNQSTEKPSPIMDGGSVTDMMQPELMGYFVSFPGETLSSLGTGGF